MSEAPERIVTRHYANGIVNARSSEEGFSFSGGNYISEAEYIRKDLHTAEIARLQERVTELEGALIKCRDEIDGYIWQEYPADHPVYERYRKRDFAANPARVALSKVGSE